MSLINYNNPPDTFLIIVFYNFCHTPIDSSQMDLETNVSAIFSNLSLNIDMGKK
jgi:hypothetical protein